MQLLRPLNKLSIVCRISAKNKSNSVTPYIYVVLLCFTGCADAIHTKTSAVDLVESGLKISYICTIHAAYEYIVLMDRIGHGPIHCSNPHIVTL